MLHLNLTPFLAESTYKQASIRYSSSTLHDIFPDPSNLVTHLIYNVVFSPLESYNDKHTMYEPLRPSSLSKRPMLSCSKHNITYLCYTLLLLTNHIKSDPI